MSDIRNEEFAKNLFSFIKEREKNLISIEAYKNIMGGFDIQDGDIQGIITPGYEVVCIMAVPDRGIPFNNLAGRIERVCIVDAYCFNIWMKNKNAIKWIS